MNNSYGENKAAYERKYYANNPERRKYKYENIKARRLINRQRLIDAKSKPCMDCGIKYPFYVMQFDHVSGKKEFNLSHAGRSTIAPKRILAELAKCDVVCANCHFERSYQRHWKNQRVVH
jgi:hypothetical protein